MKVPNVILVIQDGFVAMTFQTAATKILHISLWACEPPLPNNRHIFIDKNYLFINRFQTYSYPSPSPFIKNVVFMSSYAMFGPGLRDTSQHTAGRYVYSQNLFMASYIKGGQGKKEYFLYRVILTIVVFHLVNKLFQKNRRKKCNL